MQTSRFQLGLIATLAVGLGFSLASSEAVGYPAGAAVSMGSNPAWSMGRDMAYPTHTAVTAVGGDLVVSDISLSSTYNSWWRMKMNLSDGTNVANFSGTDPHTTPLHRTFSAGIRVPEGESLIIEWQGAHGADENYRYTLAGYYAQP